MLGTTLCQRTHDGASRDNMGVGPYSRHTFARSSHICTFRTAGRSRYRKNLPQSSEIIVAKHIRESFQKYTMQVPSILIILWSHTWESRLAATMQCVWSVWLLWYRTAYMNVGMYSSCGASGRVPAGHALMKRPSIIWNLAPAVMTRSRNTTAARVRVQLCCNPLDNLTNTVSTV